MTIFYPTNRIQNSCVYIIEVLFSGSAIKFQSVYSEIANTSHACIVYFTIYVGFLREKLLPHNQLAIVLNEQKLTKVCHRNPLIVFLKFAGDDVFITKIYNNAITSFVKLSSHLGVHACSFPVVYSCPYLGKRALD